MILSAPFFENMRLEFFGRRIFEALLWYPSLQFVKRLDDFDLDSVLGFFKFTPTGPLGFDLRLNCLFLRKILGQVFLFVVQLSFI